MKKLINIRGAVATGKTTCVRQYCNIYGYRVEVLHLKSCDFPITLIDSQNVVILGDYGRETNCTGCDSISKRNGESIGISGIATAVIAVAKKYCPNAIIYEHMIGSQIYKGTKRIADAGIMAGYEYCGIQLWRTQSNRLAMLEKRSGAQAKTKNFWVHGARVDRATEMLNEHGYRVKKVNADKIAYNDMWQVLENEINEN